jgi:hypothetical protein
MGKQDGYSGKPNEIKTTCRPMVEKDGKSGKPNDVQLRL